MDLKIALGLLVALMCVPSGWSYVRDREVAAEKEFYEYDYEFASSPRPPVLPFPGFYSAKKARIVGGDGRREHEFPFMVLLNLKGKPWCGGTILDELHVVTAAHCVEKSTAEHYEVVAGEHDHSVTEGMEQRVDVQEIYLHPSYKKWYYNDVAVLKLAAPLKFNDAVRSIALNSDGTCPTVTQTCTAAGWGSTSIPNGPGSRVPLYIDLLVVDPGICQWLYRGIFDRGQLCVGRLGKDTCTGDSGGPLVSDCGGRKLVGITSHGRGCAVPGIPGSYVKVSHYYYWIMAQTRK